MMLQAIRLLLFDKLKGTHQLILKFTFVKNRNFL